MEIDFSPDRSLYPFESRWFASSRGRVHYVDEGAGPPLLLCHGNPTWSFLYRQIVRALRDRFRCVAIDYLGFGCPSVPRATATRSTNMQASWASSSMISPSRGSSRSQRQLHDLLITGVVR
jgi:pimeloyl-ACP methyl ester carboxylesterase